MKKADPFVQAPEFLAAFNNIATNGFFEQCALNVLGFEGDVTNCSIKVIGYIPNNKSYQRNGVGALLNPEAIITSCKAVTGRHKVKNVSVTVKTGDWVLYDKAGKNIIGSKGTRTEMSISIMFVF
jgi:hypothetical protein